MPQQDSGPHFTIAPKPEVSNEDVWGREGVVDAQGGEHCRARGTMLPEEGDTG